MAIDNGLHSLWPTPLGVERYADFEELNRLLVRVFGVIRAAQLHARGARQEAFFASTDDLLRRVDLPEWHEFLKFLIRCVRDTVTLANRSAWPAPSVDLTIAIEGMWFQCANRGAFHDLHTHGNCSWSGVYVVQVDEPASRAAHPVYGAANGVTRLYGPSFAALAGGHADLGNAYLQPPHIDIEPVPGQLVLFPSWLAHQALPYDGDSERIIISLNASVHAQNQSDELHAYSAH